MLAACDREALELGLNPGLPLADARARVPGLGVFEHDPEADQTLLQWLVDMCNRYTPSCALHPPETIMLDISGVEHLYGGEQNLLVDLKRRLTKLGLSSRISMGITPDSARARARFNCQDIYSLPVEALDIDFAAVAALRKAGLKSIGDLAVRPRPPLAARFGKLCTLRLARLLEEEDPRISPVPALLPIRTQRRFAEPLVNSEAVLVILSELAAEAAVLLAERGEGGRCFGARLFRSDGHVAQLSIETSAPTRNPKLLDRLFRERIDALADPLDPGFGYDMITLDILHAELLANLQVGIRDSTDARDDLHTLVDRLSTRLGKQKVNRFQPRESHIPERAAVLRNVLSGMPEGRWQEAEPGEPPLRPLILFEPPQPVEVTAVDVPDGPPASFRWRRQTYRIVLAEGPERIEPEWWRYAKGYQPQPAILTRDYYRVEEKEGRRFWLFRKGLYGEADRPGWYIHGAFA